MKARASYTKRQIMTQNQSSREEPIEYAIFVLHRREGFGRHISFASTYYAKAKSDKAFMKRVFRKAFHQAHPSWKIEEVTVEPAATSPSKKHNEILAIAHK